METNKNMAMIWRKQLVCHWWCIQRLGEFIFIFIFADATTLLGTNRKTDSGDTKSADTKVPTKLTQDDFKTVYVSKIAPEEEKDAQRKEKNKAVDLDDDQYEVVDTSYVYIKLKQKWIGFFFINIRF